MGALFWALDATSCALLQLVGTRDAKRRAFPKRKQDKYFGRKSLPRLMVETRGFEPPTSRVRVHNSGGSSAVRKAIGLLQGSVLAKPDDAGAMCADFLGMLRQEAWSPFGLPIADCRLKSQIGNRKSEIHAWAGASA